MYLTAPCVYLQTEGSLFGCAAQICPVCAVAGQLARPSICGRENTSPYQGRPNGFAGLNCTSFNATTDAADPLCVVPWSVSINEHLSTNSSRQLSVTQKCLVSYRRSS